MYQDFILKERENRALAGSGSGLSRWVGAGTQGLRSRKAWLAPCCHRAARGPNHSLHHVSIPEQTRDAGSLFFLFPGLCFIFHKSLLFPDVSKYTVEHTGTAGTLTSTESPGVSPSGTPGKACGCGLSRETKLREKTVQHVGGRARGGGQAKAEGAGTWAGAWIQYGRECSPHLDLLFSSNCLRS